MPEIRTEVLRVSSTTEPPDVSSTPPADDSGTGPAIQPQRSLEALIGHHSELLPPEVAAARVDFPVWFFADVPEGWTVDVAHWPQLEAWGLAERVVVLYQASDGDSFIYLDETSSELATPGGPGWLQYEREGLRLYVCREQLSGAIRISLEKDATVLDLRSQNVPLVRLFHLVATVRTVPS